METGTSLRRARMAAGLRLRDVSVAVGRSISWLSRVERGRLRSVALEDLIVIGAATGVRIWVGTYPSERAIHDAPQIALLRRFRERAGPAWAWSFEVPVPDPHDRRAADAVMSAAGVTIMVEAFTRLDDVQAQLRAVHLKARDLGASRLVVVVAATNANRRAIAGAEHVLASDYPLGTKATLRALRAGRDPGANGVVLV